MNYFNIYKGERRYLTSISSETIGEKIISIDPFMIVYNNIMGSKSPVSIFTNADEKSLKIIPNIENVPQQDIDFWKRNVINAPLTTGDYKVDNSLSPIFIIFFSIIIGGGIYIFIKK